MAGEYQTLGLLLLPAADIVCKHMHPPSHSWNTVARYAVRFVTCLLTMEVILHFMYVVAIKDTAAWRGDTPLELSMIGFWNLIIVWLKVRATLPLP